MTGTALSAQLALNNVTLSSEAGATAGNGDIVVNDGVSWSADTVLTLSAGRNVNVNAVVEGLGDKSGVALNVMGGDYNFGMGGKIRLPGVNASFAVNGQAYTLIHDVQQLQDMDKNLNGFYALGNDVDASETLGWNDGLGFSPIGGGCNDCFKGKLTGLSNDIGNMFIGYSMDVYRQQYVGLFSAVGENGVARDLKLDILVQGNDRVGAVAGALHGSLKNITVTGFVKGGYGIGGVVGRNIGGVIDSVDFQGRVEGRDGVGGFVGIGYGGINSSTFKGEINFESGFNGVAPVDYSVSNSYYSIEDVLVNGRQLVASSGIFRKQFDRWLASGKSELSIADYTETLPLVGDSYVISSVQGLRDALPFAGLLGYKFALGNDIDLKEAPGLYIPVFRGRLFDGKGFSIKNMNLNYPDLDNVGFIGQMPDIDRDPYTQEIKNINFEAAFVSGRDGVGVLVGTVPGGSIIDECWPQESCNDVFNNIVVNGEVHGRNKVGGLVGMNGYGYGSGFPAYFDNVLVSGLVKGEDYVGGIIGLDGGGRLNKSNFSGEVYGKGRVGGLIGEMSPFDWKNSYYNIDDVKINGAHTPSTQGVYGGQFDDWLNHGKSQFVIADYLSLNDEGYYQIGSIDALKNMLPFLYSGSNKFKLVADIDLVGHPNLFLPVFGAGEFNGGGHVIKGLNVDNPNISNQGFIGWLQKGVVRDFVISGASVKGYDDVGVLFGNGVTPFYSASKSVEKVFIEGASAGHSNVGLVGGRLDWYGGVTSVEARGHVSGGEYVGGLLGHAEGSLHNSTFSGSVNGVGNVGGLTGDWFGGDVINSYYNIDDSEINGGHVPTTYGVYSKQYNDWLSGNKAGLSPQNYSVTLPFKDECECYEISSEQGLRDALPFVLNPDNKFSLQADINISSNDGFHFPLFRTSLDGHGHTISNVFIDSPKISGLGFFGALVGNVKDVVLDNIDINGLDTVGAFAGWMGWEATLEQVMARGKVKGNSGVGGIAGDISVGKISQAASFVKVTGVSSVGGIAGYSDRWDGGGISDSYSSGEVAGESSVGGVLGYAYATSLQNVYSTSIVSGVSKTGGLVGEADWENAADNSYWSTESGKVYDGSSLGAGVTTAQLKDINTFANWSISDHPNEDTIWRIYDKNSMPLLRHFLKPISLKVDSLSASYTGHSNAPSFSYSCVTVGCDSGKILGTSVFTGDSVDAVNVGVYNITLDGYYSEQLGYDIDVISGKLTIKPAPLTVTLSNANKVYDGQTYSGGAGVTYSGLVNGESESVLSGTLSYGGTAQGARNVGEYSLTASGQTAANYTLSYVDGKLTINPAAITIAAVPDSKSYDGNNFSSMAPVVIGLKGTDSITGLVQAFNNANAGLGNSLSVVGYTVNDGNNGENYTISTNAAVGKITPATLAVSVINAQKVYNGQIYSGGAGVTYNGFVNGETESVLTGILSYGGTAQGARNVGKYSLTASGQSAANYALTYVDGQLNLSPRNLNFDFTNRDKTYDATRAAHLTVLDDRISGDQLIVNYQSALYTDKNVGTGKFIDINGIEATGADAANYQFHSSTSTTGNITPKELSVSGLAIADKIPDGTN